VVLFGAVNRALLLSLSVLALLLLGLITLAAKLSAPYIYTLF
jgi:hypothetical protein